jgi:FG-GAP-like repeat
MRISALLLAVTMLAPAGLALAPGAQAAPSAPARAAAAQAATPASAGTATRPVSSGTFRSVVYLKNAVSPGVAPPDAVDIADVTGDGRPDLVVVTVDHSNAGGGTTVAVYRQRDNGTLAAPVTAKDSSAYQNVYPLDTIADLYRNGQKEIIIPEAYNVDVFAYRHGRLTGPTRIPISAGNLRVADMNGDGHPDLLTTDFYGHAQIYLGSTAHTFKLWRTLSFPVGGDPWPALFNSDLNHDGRMDIAHRNEYSFSVRMQPSRDRFSTVKTYNAAPVGGAPFEDAAMAIGDVTGDGRPDVIIASGSNSPGAGVEVFAGTGSGTFKAPVFYPTLDLPMGMTVADLNGDGRKDLVINHDGWNAIGVMLQTSKGTFAPEKLYPAPAEGDTPAVGDLNGDGKPDIAVVAGSDGIAILYAK